MIQGENIYLRIVTRADLEQLEQWENNLSVLSEYNFFGLHGVGSQERHFAEDGMLSAQFGRLLVVTLAGEVAGDISYRQVHYGPRDSVAYNIGISLVPEQRGKGYGSEAQKLVAAYLFSTYPIMRVEASTDIENIPEQRPLEKVGFTREGVLRKVQWRSGGWHDLVLYSKLRGEA